MLHPTYPGVYIQEVPSGVRTVAGVPTSLTAFIGRALRGPVDTPVTINNFADFQRIFGGLWVNNSLGYAVNDFFTNGGGQAIIVRVTDASSVTTPPENAASSALSTQVAVSPIESGLDLIALASGASGNNISFTIGNLDSTAGTFDLSISNPTINPVIPENYPGLTLATISSKLSDSELIILRTVPPALPTAEGTFKLSGGGDSTSANALFKAASPGVWGNNLQISVNYNASEAVADQYGLPISALFNLVVTDTGTGAVEQYYNVTMVTYPPNPAQLDQVLTNQSSLIELTDPLPPNSSTTPRPNNIIYTFSQGNDGQAVNATNILGVQSKKEGLYALENVPSFNLLCIPGYNISNDVDDNVMTAAAAYCVSRRAFYVIDAPTKWTNVSQATSGVAALVGVLGNTNAANCAVYFPRVQEADPLSSNQIKTFGPCGMIAGTMAYVDGQSGVWKAPAGLQAGLAGINQLSLVLTDAENGQLNPLAVNCLRTFPAAGSVIWGARTLQGNDQLGSQWKYIPVRRFALYIEQSIYQGSKWAVFEANDEPLWRQLALSIGSFMDDLFRKGAFKGQSAKDAYFVKCDSSTTTQNDIDNGIVNVQVGFAPLKPAEFVIISIQQIAGQN